MMSPRAGQPAAAEDLADIAKLVTAYYALHPDPGEAAQRVSFGTSGHRGSALTATFNEDHILAVTQAICEYRAADGIGGPLYLGVDTHALSEPAQVSALEVLAANDVRVLLDARGGYTPTPAVSRAILAHNAAGPGPAPTGSWSRPPITRPRTAVSSTTRRMAARPARTSPGRSRTGRTPCSRTASRASAGSRTRARSRRTAPGGSTSPAPTCRRWTRWSTSPRSGPPGCASAPTRWAAPASATGARSASATAWTSPSSTRTWIPGSGS